MILIGSADRTAEVATFADFDSFRYMKNRIPPPAMNGTRRIKSFIGHQIVDSEGVSNVGRTRVVSSQAAALDDGLLGRFSTRILIFCQSLYPVS